MDQEVEYIMREARKFVNRNQSCAILFPTKDKVLEFCDTVLQLEHKPVWENGLINIMNLILNGLMII